MGPSSAVRRARGGSPGPIPSTLSEHLCIDFVNSRFSDHTGGGGVHDRLDAAEWRRWFADRCRIAVEPTLGAGTRRDLENVRTWIRSLLESRRPPDTATVDRLNRCLVPACQSWELGFTGRQAHLALRWNDSNWSTLIGAVVASYAQLFVNGGLNRVRVCANPHCSFMFYDDSRNGSRRWCDAAVCGNLLKVRQHRARATVSGSVPLEGQGRSNKGANAAASTNVSST